MIQRLPREYPAEFVSQPSMAAGEVGPELWGRVDQDFYYIGMRTVRNWIVRQYGGASNRMGLRHVAEARYNDKDFRLVKFQFNEEQTYVLEIGDQYMRVIADGGQVIENSIVVSGITQASPAVVTAVGHGLNNGDDVYLSGIVGMIQLNNRTFRIANVTTDTFELNDYQGNPIDTSGYFAYTSGGTISRIYTVATPWSHDDVFELGFTQSNDVLTVVHPDYYPRDITRTGNTAWTVSLFDNKAGPFADKNIDSNITVTVNGGVTVNVTNVTDNGSGLIRLTVDSTTGIITGDTATIFGIAGIPPLRGTTQWVVTVVDGTTLDLQASTFSGAYAITRAYARTSVTNSSGKIALSQTGIGQFLAEGDTVTFDTNAAYPALSNRTYVIESASANLVVLEDSVYVAPPTIGAWTTNMTLLNGGGVATTRPTSAGYPVTLTASAGIFNADMIGDLFYLEQEPTDSTPTWEAAKYVNAGAIRRAGTHYYKANFVVKKVNIAGITASTAPYVTTTGAHGLSTGDFIYIEDVVGMTQVNDRFFAVKARNSTTFFLQKADNPSEADSTAGYTAYVSGGTATEAKKTGTIKPDWTEGSQVDGSSGVEWEYLHSGFGIVRLTGYTSDTVMTGEVMTRVPESIIGNPTSIWAKSAWSQEEGYPSAAVYHKGRLIFGATAKQPSILWMSKAKVRNDFSESNPILDDEAITIKLNATDMNAIRHLLPLQDLITLTSAAEFLIKGDADGALLASQPPNPIIQGYTGSSKVPPIVIGNTAIMVQDVGSSVHSLKYQFDSDSFGGIDLTARSPHLFRNKSIRDWAYQRHPFSVVWTVMDDGALNGFTFMEEQRVYAWHRHDSDNAKFLTTATIREGRETSAYFGIERDINNTKRRYIEVFASRFFKTVEDAFFVDSGVTYDGRNKGSATITITGGSTWLAADAEDLTITCSTGIFTALDAEMRNQIVFITTDDDGATIRLAFEITEYTSSTVVTAIPIRDVPVAYRNTARTDWNFAKRRFFGLDHIEGKTISCLSEGNVIPGLTVTNGEVTMTEPGYIVHLGIGYVCDLETLDLAGPQGSTKAKMISVPAAHIHVQETKSLAVGNNGFKNVKRAPARSVGIGYDPAIPASTGMIDVVLNSSFSRQGRLCIREDQPIPATVNCITLELESGDNG